MKKAVALGFGLVGCLTISAHAQGRRTKAMAANNSLSATAPADATSAPKTYLQVPNQMLAPESGRFLFQAGIMASQFKVSVEGSGYDSTYGSYKGKSDSKSESTSEVLAMSYGINSMFYVGGQITYADRKNTGSSETQFANGMTFAPTSTSDSSKGTSDPQLIAGLRLRGDEITNLTEISLTPSTGTAQESSSTRDGNNLNGQTQIGVASTLYNHVRSSVLVGGTMGYTHALEGKMNRQSSYYGTTYETNRIVTGGDNARAEGFVQFPDALNLQARIVYARSMSKQYKTDDAYKIETSDNGSEVAMLDTSLRIRPATNFAFVPGLSYAQLLNYKFSSDSKITSQSWLQGYVSGRFSF